MVFEYRAPVAPVDGAEAYPALELPYRGKGATVKALDEFESVFIRAVEPGPELEFTIEQPKARRRMLYLTAPESNCYGIVQVLVNGKPVGEPFSTYQIGTRVRAYRPIGEADFRKGANTVTFRIVGKDPNSANFFTSVQTIHLR